MKILFVCVANVGRSQMAEAFCNQLSKHEASSAGTQVGDHVDQTLADRSREPEASSTPGFMLKIMLEEEGLDLYGCVRKQLTPELVEEAHKVVVMCLDDPYQNYLDGNPKVTFWNIPDLYGEPYEAVRALKEDVKRHVAALLQELDS